MACMTHICLICGYEVLNNSTETIYCCCQAMKQLFDEDL